MTGRAGAPAGLALTALLVALVVAAVLWLPRFWENRLYRQVEAIAGVEAPLLGGSVTEARKRIDPGKMSNAVVGAVGRPSISVRTEGSSTHDVWTYYYPDGTMTVNLTDGVVVRISLSYGPPKIPTSARPR